MRVSDIIAYLGKDRQDAVKLHIIDGEKQFDGGRIGTSNAEIINNMIVNIVENSYGKPYLQMDEDYFRAFSKGKQENYTMIYGNKAVDRIYQDTIQPMMESIYKKLLKDAKEHNRNSVLYTHHIDYIHKLTQYYSGDRKYEENEPNLIVVDYISGMTDDYFVDLYKHLFPDGKYVVEYKGYF